MLLNTDAVLKMPLNTTSYFTCYYFEKNIKICQMILLTRNTRSGHYGQLSTQCEPDTKHSFGSVVSAVRALARLAQSLSNRGETSSHWKICVTIHCLFALSRVCDLQQRNEAVQKYG